ncbi:hypothetical protein M1397_02235 [Candidatus Marsarchaeota archaeon]|nr:hypothetical protein [Candidatus Marsarchaeota archaeon]
MTVVLSAFLTREFLRKRFRALLYWSIGMWFFVIGVLIEVFFAFGFYNMALANSYMLVVALLVEFLALGSIQLVKSIKIRSLYYLFCAASTLLLLYTIATAPATTIINPYRIAITFTSVWVAVSSSLITFPAAVILVIVAALTYARTKNAKMLSIIAGVVIVSIAGTLYIAAIPVFLYYSEFVGIVLLWFGFFSFKMLKSASNERKHNKNR